MFAYCANNPVSFTDPSGNMFIARDDLGSAPVGFSTAGFDPQGSFSSGSPGSLGRKIIYFLTNSDEAAIIDTNSIAFYNGIPYIKVPGDNGAFSFGMVFMTNGVKSNNLVRHEYGHTVQLRKLGIPAYTVTVAIPSVTFYALTKNGYLPDSLYYSLPWEYKANEFGGATGKYTQWAEATSNVYWTLSKMVSFLYYLS